MSFEFYIYSSTAVIAGWFGWRKLDSGTRLPWAIFVVVYFLTTVIGATVIGMPDGLDFLELFNPTLDIGVVRNAIDDRYWILLFLPVTLPTVLLLYTKRLALPWEITATKWFQRENADRAVFFATAFLSLLLSGYSLLLLGIKGHLGNIFLAFSGMLDFKSTILLRHQMMDAMNGRGIYYYEIAYVSLPTLSWVAFYKMFKNDDKDWRILFWLQFLAVVFLLLSSIQKAPLLIYFIGVAIGLAYLGKLKVHRLVILGILGVTLLTFMQSYYVDDWSSLMTIFHSIFRLSSSFIYYVIVYPQYEPYQSINYGLGLLGFGVSMNDNLIIFDYMYPDVFWTQGAAAAASHLRAYTQGGVVWACVALVIVSLFIRFLGCLRQSLSGPIGFAFLVQSGVSLYYLTQTSIRGAFLESYGLLWAVLPLFFLIVLSSILRNAVAKNRRFPPVQSMC